MTVTTLDTINYGRSEEAIATPEVQSDDRISIWQLPKLALAGAALFSMNLIIGIGMIVTPNIEADVYGHEVSGSYSNTSKPSPFTPTVDTSKHKVRLAAKAKPVLVEVAPAWSDSYVESATLDIPRASRAAYQLDLPVRTQNAVYEMPRATYMPRTSERAVHQTTVDTSANAKEKRLLVIN